MKSLYSYNCVKFALYILVLSVKSNYITRDRVIIGVYNAIHMENIEIENFLGKIFIHKVI